MLIEHRTKMSVSTILQRDCAQNPESTCLSSPDDRGDLCSLGPSWVIQRGVLSLEAFNKRCAGLTLPYHVVFLCQVDVIVLSHVDEFVLGYSISLGA